MFRSEFPFIDANPLEIEQLNYFKFDDCERTSYRGGLILTAKDEQKILIVFYKECQFKVYAVEKANKPNVAYLYEGKPLQLSKLTIKKPNDPGCSAMPTTVPFLKRFCIYRSHKKVAPLPTSAV